MKRFEFTRGARDDLQEIADYIAADSPEAARRVVAQIRKAVERLADVPELGHVREDLGPVLLRFWPVYSYLVIYRGDIQPLQVIRILHGARDVERILSSL